MRHPFLRTLAGSAATPTDPNFENVTLLLHGDGTNGGQNNTFVDGSTNNFTITRNGNTTQGTFSPYGDNWSNYFDGNGDRLRLDDSGDWDFGTSDFTIEMWVCFNVLPTTDSNTRQTLISTYESTSPPRGWNLQIGVGPNNVVNWGWGDTLILASSAPGWKVNQWYHLAVARSGTSVKIFIDGAQVGSATDSTSLTGSANGVTIGALYFSVPGGTFVQHTNAYISNVRILKGTAQYTAAFTPSTTPLTAITNTVLLTCQSNRFKDNSSSNRTITRNGDVSVQRFSPFSPTAAYAAGTIGGSGYFDGTGDYLSASSNAAFSFDTGNFTIECFFYPTSTDSTQYVYLLDSTGGITFGFEPVASVASFVLGRRGTAVDLSATYTIVPFQWLHLVAVRSGTTASLYINGTRVATGTNSQNYTVSGPVNVGAIATAGGYETNGYLSNVRVVKGTAVYDPTQTTLTVPTAPLTAITNTSLLLDFTNAAILDNAMMSDLETVGNAQIDTTTKKYGTGSLKFDGTGDRLVIPANPNFLFGTGDWTVEAWVYIAGNSSANAAGNRDACIFAISNASSAAMALIVIGNTTTTGTRLQLVKETNTNVDINNAQSISQGVWHHIAACKASNTIRLFFNGTQVGSNVTDTTIWGSSTLPGNVGSLQRTGYIDDLNGYIDDLRITKGVARYTANFTPPTAALPDL